MTLSRTKVFKPSFFVLMAIKITVMLIISFKAQTTKNKIKIIGKMLCNDKQIKINAF